MKVTAAGIILAGSWTTVFATDNDANLLQRPAWLTEASLGVKESYDNNVFLAGASTPFVYTVPPGSVAALKDHASWITTVSPKVDFNFAPLLGDQKNLQILSLAYAPEFAIYHDQDSESYKAHKFSAAVKGGADWFTVSADNTLTYVDGNQFGPVFPGSLLSAFATVADRERREQFVDKGNVALQFSRGAWFVRPVMALYYQDMLTAKLEVPGYQNYTDRSDVNGGADLGYHITESLAVTAGYRYGHQQEEQFGFTPYSSPNDYQRVLFGIEGKPWTWLDVKLQAGPDFRSYEGNYSGHITPVNDRNPVKYYDDVLIAAKLTAADTLSFKCKHWQWLSTLGKIPYFDSAYELNYHRKLTSKLGFDLGGHIWNWDYTSSGNLSNCRRNDTEYTASAGVAYAVNPHLSLNAAFTVDLGRNAQNRIEHPETREFDHQLVSLGAVCKF
ncbi:MAG TPA: hypothetical protein VF988_01285 [Verrucomicrobiae bacterium]